MNDNQDNNEDQEFLELVTFKKGAKLGIEIQVTMNKKYAFVDNFTSNNSISFHAGVRRGDIIARLNNIDLLNYDKDDDFDLINSVANEIAYSNDTNTVEPLVVWFMRPKKAFTALLDIINDYNLYVAFHDWLKNENIEMLKVLDCYVDCNIDHGELKDDFVKYHYPDIITVNDCLLIPLFNKFIESSTNLNGYFYKSIKRNHLGIKYISNERFLCYFFLFLSIQTNALKCFEIMGIIKEYKKTKSSFTRLDSLLIKFFPMFRSSLFYVQIQNDDSIDDNILKIMRIVKLPSFLKEHRLLTSSSSSSSSSSITSAPSKPIMLGIKFKYEKGSLKSSTFQLHATDQSSILLQSHITSITPFLIPNSFMISSTTLSSFVVSGLYGVLLISNVRVEDIDANEIMMSDTTIESPLTPTTDSMSKPSSTSTSTSTSTSPLPLPSPLPSPAINPLLTKFNDNYNIISNTMKKVLPSNSNLSQSIASLFVKTKGTDDAVNSSLSPATSPASSIPTSTPTPTPTPTPTKTSSLDGEGICLFSSQPILGTLRNLLVQAALPQSTVNEGINIDEIEKILIDKSIKAKIKLKSFSSKYGNDLTTTLTQINPRNLTVLVLAMMLEIKIIITSSITRSHIVILGEYLKDAIKPLEYCHLYLPNVPTSSANQITDCPTPYFLGLAKSDIDFDSLTNDILIFDMDNDIIRIPSLCKTVLLSHHELIQRVTLLLRPNYINGDVLNNNTSTNKDSDALGVLQIFNDFVFSFLRKTKDHCISFISDSKNDKNLIFFFNEYSYIKDITTNSDGDITDHTLALLFVRTQCFSNFITQQKKIVNIN